LQNPSKRRRIQLLNNQIQKLFLSPSLKPNSHIKQKHPTFIKITARP